jgi:hypothetical protein
MVAFSDIALLSSGPLICNFLGPALQTKLRASVAKSEVIQWGDTIGYTIDDAKLTYYGYGWGKKLYSLSPLWGNIIYIQVRINVLDSEGVHEDGGVTLGVSDYDNDIRLMNTTTGNGCEYTCFNAGAGDIIGVVVDNIQDCVRYYKNGRLEDTGLGKPSQLKSVYAVLELFFCECEVETGEFYRYDELLDN